MTFRWLNNNLISNVTNIYDNFAILSISAVNGLGSHNPTFEPQYIDVDNAVYNLAPQVWPGLSFTAVITGGGRGDDLIIGSANLPDNIAGGDGNDRIYLGAGDFSFSRASAGYGSYRGTFENVGRGGQGDDTIVGWEQSDFLSGEQGTDVLIGGGGNDVFRFIADIDPKIGAPGSDYGGEASSAYDYIADFASGQDKILIDSDYIFNYLDLMNNAAIYQESSSTVIEFNNGDGVLVLNNFTISDLKSADFLFTGGG